MVWIIAVSLRRKPSLSASKIAIRETSGKSRPSRSRFIPTSTSKTIYKEQRQLIKLTKIAEDDGTEDYSDNAIKKRSEKELQKMAKELEKRMAVAAKELNFELAAELRDRLIGIKGQLGQKLSPKPKNRSK